MTSICCLCVAVVIFLFLPEMSEGATCDPQETLCRFSLTIEPRLTMMNGTMRVRPCNGRLCNYNSDIPLCRSIEEEASSN